MNQHFWTPIDVYVAHKYCENCGIIKTRLNYSTPCPLWEKSEQLNADDYKQLTEEQKREFIEKTREEMDRAMKKILELI